MIADNTWGWFPEFDEKGAEGSTAAIDACKNGSTVLVTFAGPGGLQIEFEEHTAKVSSEGFVERPKPEYVWGQDVLVVDKGQEAKIASICWHFNNETYFYLIEINGKKNKRRYFANELEPIP